MAEPVGEVNADRAGDEDASSGRRLVNAVMALAAQGHYQLALDDDEPGIGDTQS